MTASAERLTRQGLRNLDKPHNGKRKEALVNVRCDYCCGRGEITDWVAFPSGTATCPRCDGRGRVTQEES